MTLIVASSELMRDLAIINQLRYSMNCWLFGKEQVNGKICFEILEKSARAAELHEQNVLPTQRNHQSMLI